MVTHESSLGFPSFISFAFSCIFEEFIEDHIRGPGPVGPGPGPVGPEPERTVLRTYLPYGTANLKLQIIKKTQQLRQIIYKPIFV